MAASPPTGARRTPPAGRRSTFLPDPCRRLRSRTPTAPLASLERSGDQGAQRSDDPRGDRCRQPDRQRVPMELCLRAQPEHRPAWHGPGVEKLLGGDAHQPGVVMKGLAERGRSPPGRGFAEGSSPWPGRRSRPRGSPPARQQAPSSAAATAAARSRGGTPSAGKSTKAAATESGGRSPGFAQGTAWSASRGGLDGASTSGNGALCPREQEAGRSWRTSILPRRHYPGRFVRSKVRSHPLRPVLSEPSRLVALVKERTVPADREGPASRLWASHQ